MKENKKVNFKVINQSGRLDKVVSEEIKSISRSQAKELIDSNHILVNDNEQKPKYKVLKGDLITITIPTTHPIELKPENLNLDIVYEDEDVLVVNKPQGLVVHPAPGHPDHTLVNGLLYHTKLLNINGSNRPGIVHRIDKDTSGLLMVAKTNIAQQSLSKQLKDKTNFREYLALVHGVIKENEGTIKAPIGRSLKDRKKMAIVENGREAITHFKVIKRFHEYTLVSCQLETGRTHQIRVHMKYIGHPLVGDPLYGPHKTIKGKGQFLHASKLGFMHPVTKKLMTFQVPIPDIFKHTLEKLEKDED